MHKNTQSLALHCYSIFLKRSLSSLQKTKSSGSSYNFIFYFTFSLFSGAVDYDLSVLFLLLQSFFSCRPKWNPHSHFHSLLLHILSLAPFSFSIIITFAVEGEKKLTKLQDNNFCVSFNRIQILNVLLLMFFFLDFFFFFNFYCRINWLVYYSLKPKIGWSNCVFGRGSMGFFGALLGRW